MCKFHQGQRCFNTSFEGRIYGRIILFVTNEIFLAIRGGPYMTIAPFYPLNGKADINRFPANWQRSKAPHLLPSAVYFTASTNWTSKSPDIISYGINYGTRNIARTLIKISDYAKGVIQQTSRHVEKASSLKFE